MIACSSDKGTIHIFALSKGGNGSTMGGIVMSKGEGGIALSDENAPTEHEDRGEVKNKKHV